jgi:hypothetical protein
MKGAFRSRIPFGTALSVQMSHGFGQPAAWLRWSLPSGHQARRATVSNRYDRPESATNGGRAWRRPLEHPSISPARLVSTLAINLPTEELLLSATPDSPQCAPYAYRLQSVMNAYDGTSSTMPVGSI